VLTFAGLWDEWKDPQTGERLRSSTIIVTKANEFTRAIHDRMPVLLGAERFGPWLSGEAATELLQPAPNRRVTHVAGIETGEPVGPGQQRSKSDR
jgi:putative SOS response-associated peptidase YedK